MKTVLASLLGLYLIASDIMANGLEEHLLENHLVWGGAVICAVIATIISLWTMDWDETGPKIMVIAVDGIVALDAAARLLAFIFSGNIFTSGILKPNLGWLTIVPVILLFVSPFKNDETKEKTVRTDEDKLDGQIMFAGMVLIALLTFVILMTNSDSEDNFMLVSIMEGLLGAKTSNPPTLFNFLDWSIRMKLVGILALFFVILSFIKDTGKNLKKIVGNIYDNGIFYGLSISVVYWFVMLREHVIIPLAESNPFGIVYFVVFFADLAFTVGFGFCVFFLPIFAVGSALPGTTATILKGANDMMNGVFDSADTETDTNGSVDKGKEVLDEYKAIHDLNNLPNCMKDDNGTWWYRNHVGNPGNYQTLDRKVEIQIYSATISNNQAHTDKGMFYW